MEQRKSENDGFVDITWTNHVFVGSSLRTLDSKNCQSFLEMSSSLQVDVITQISCSKGKILLKPLINIQKLHFRLTYYACC